jgi:hypothetical protein
LSDSTKNIATRTARKMPAKVQSSASAGQARISPTSCPEIAASTRVTILAGAPRSASKARSTSAPNSSGGDSTSTVWIPMRNVPSSTRLQ